MVVIFELHEWIAAFFLPSSFLRFVNRHRYTIRPACHCRCHCHWLYALEWSASIIFRISITPTRDGIFHESHTSLNVTKRQHTQPVDFAFHIIISSYHHCFNILPTICTCTSASASMPIVYSPSLPTTHSHKLTLTLSLSHFFSLYLYMPKHKHKPKPKHKYKHNNNV